MGRLNEILESGVAPGFSGLAQDPSCADAAVPRAMRELMTGDRKRITVGRYFSTRHERGMGEKELVSKMGFAPTKKNIKDIRSAWKV